MSLRRWRRGRPFERARVAAARGCPPVRGALAPEREGAIVDFSKIKSLLGGKGPKNDAPDAEGRWTCDHCGKKGLRIGAPDYTVIFVQPDKKELPGLLMGTVRQCQSCHHMTCTECVANTRNLTCPECGVPCEVIADDINSWCIDILNDNIKADITMHVSTCKELGTDSTAVLNQLRGFLRTAQYSACDDFYAQMYALRFHHGVVSKVWSKEELMLAGVAMKMKATGSTDLFSAVMNMGSSGAKSPH
jgi:hypothetical protein